MAQTKSPIVSIDFPLGGIDRSMSYSRQPARPMGNGRYARTTPTGQNVRSYEPSTDRCRGGSRAGLSRYVNAQAGGSSALIQYLGVVVGSGYSPPGGTTQTSLSGRVVTLVAVVGGNVYTLDSGGTAWTTATNDTGYNPPLASTGIIRGAELNGVLYLVSGDGSRVAKYDPSVSKVKTWGATAGTFPTDSSGNYPRLICEWNHRIVLSGLAGDPQNWFMSAMDNASDFNYSPDSTTPSQAESGNNEDLGKIGDFATGLIPFSNDLLIFGGDSSLFQMSGDPMAGGRIDRISDVTGMAFGEAWCKDAGGTIYFLGNEPIVFRMVPGQQPLPISQGIASLLSPINTGTYGVRLLYDAKQMGIHVFVTKTSAAAATTHFYHETRSGSWWTDVFADKNMNPLACCTFDGNTADDRVPLIGSWDGYVRAVDPAADTDDTEDIASEVLLGPLLTENLDDVMVREGQLVLGEDSGDVTWELLKGRTAEAALSNDPFIDGTATAGRNNTVAMRAAGHALYLKLSSTERWAMESFRAAVLPRGKVRQRGAY